MQAYQHELAYREVRAYPQRVWPKVRKLEWHEALPPRVNEVTRTVNGES
jgi:hypothetical protein